MLLMVGGVGALAALAVAAGSLVVRDHGAGDGDVVDTPIVAGPAGSTTGGAAGGTSIATMEPPAGNGTVGAPEVRQPPGSGGEKKGDEPSIVAAGGPGNGGAKRPTGREPDPPRAELTNEGADDPTLDRLNEELTHAPEAARAQRIASELQALLPRLRSAKDSTWARVDLVYAHMFAGDEQGACRALATARPMARGGRQQEAVRQVEKLTTGC